MILGIDPKVDYAFKKLFGTPANSGMLIDLLNAVLELPPDKQIIDVEIQNPFNEKEFEGDKISIVDVKARDQQGRLFNVEMQMLATSDFPQRILYYWSKLFHQQLHEGDPYHLLQPTYSVCFLNHTLFPEVSDHHLTFRLLDVEHKLTFAEELAIHLIELPKFALSAEALATRLDRWCYFLKYAVELDRGNVPPLLDLPPIQLALKVLIMMTQSDTEREQYEARLKRQRDHDAVLDYATKQGIKLGKIELVLGYERLLRRTPTEMKALLPLSLDELDAKAKNLESELAALVPQ